MTVRVLLADDHDLLREGLAAILSADAELEVVGEVADGAAAVRRATTLRPDVVLMDVQMPGGDGIAATAEVLRAAPGSRVIVLTTFDLDDYVLGALRAGASGFLVKTTPPAEIVAAVKTCAAGDTILGPTVMARLVETYVNHGPGSAPAELESLTPRERDILVAMGRGLSNAEIGEHLFLAETTVKTHVTRVLAKLGVRDRVQAVVLAHRAGVVPRDG
jgi:DNA-binding NarL/FixJ family response regulator